jgi:Tol biopolymer transport system component
VVYARGGSRGIGVLPTDADAISDLTPLVTTADPNGYTDYSEPSWSPDGQRIAFTHREFDARTATLTTRIDTIKRDGTDQKPLIPFPQGNDSGAAYGQHPL